MRGGHVKIGMAIDRIVDEQVTGKDLTEYALTFVSRTCYRLE